jgi:hypothetical protein
MILHVIVYIAPGFVKLRDAGDGSTPGNRRGFLRGEEPRAGRRRK